MTDEHAVPEESTDVGAASRDLTGFEVVFTANGECEAHAIRAALVAAGIPTEIRMEAAQQLFAVTVDGLGAVRVMVPAERAEEARAVIANPARLFNEPTDDDDAAGSSGAET
jgi:hypothetical protein